MKQVGAAGDAAKLTVQKGFSEFIENTAAEREMGLVGLGHK